jgi:hypothetical protein
MIKQERKKSMIIPTCLPEHVLLNKDINMVYKSLVQINSNKLHELKFYKINYNFKIKIYNNLIKLNKEKKSIKL